MGLQSPTPSMAGSEMSTTADAVHSVGGAYEIMPRRVPTPNLDGMRLEIVRHGIHKLEKDAVTEAVEHVMSNAKKFDVDVALLDAQTSAPAQQLSGLYLRMVLL